MHPLHERFPLRAPEPAALLALVAAGRAKHARNQSAARRWRPSAWTAVSALLILSATACFFAVAAGYRLPSEFKAFEVTGDPDEPPPPDATPEPHPKPNPPAPEHDARANFRRLFKPKASISPPDDRDLLALEHKLLELPDKQLPEMDPGVESRLGELERIDPLALAFLGLDGARPNRRKAQGSGVQYIHKRLSLVRESVGYAFSDDPILANQGILELVALEPDEHYLLYLALLPERGPLPSLDMPVPRRPSDRATRRQVREAVANYFEASEQESPRLLQKLRDFGPDAEAMVVDWFCAFLVTARHLPPAELNERDQALIAELDAEEFAIREAATQSLMAQGPRIAPLLAAYLKKLQGNPEASFEVIARLRKVVEGFRLRPADRLRRFFSPPIQAGR
ncbi:MAG: hypothetical protein M5U26_01245 [Planctomycetota bacterium]|nr:hypothetical protein [Planctomycetota bacterium]